MIALVVAVIVMLLVFGWMLFGDRVARERRCESVRQVVPGTLRGAEGNVALEPDVQVRTMKARFLCIAVIATAVFTNAFAQAPSNARFLKYWSGLDGVFLPESVRNETFGMGLDVNHDYAPDAAEALKNNPDAPYLCAALSISQPMRHLGKNFDVRDKEKELCKAYVPTQQQIEEVRRILFPPPPSRRTLIAQHLHPSAEFDQRWAGVYYPPPSTPTEWIQGNASGRDYRADLEADFNRDPLDAARVCSRLTEAKVNEDAQLRERKTILKAVCDAFPDSRIEAAYRAQSAEESRVWMTGVLNSALDEAASYPPEIRRQKEEDGSQALPKMNGTMTAQFEAGMRIIALAPDDWRGVDAVLQRVQSVAWKSNSANADPNVVLSWLSSVYTQRSASGVDLWSWKRGQRAFLVFTGHLEEARAIAQQLADRPDHDQHALDQIYLATIDRVLGARATYDKLMSNCPAPDPTYIRVSGKPARPVKYCEDVASGFARAAREQLHGTPKGDAFSQIALETNRVALEIPQVAVSAPTVKQSPEGSTDDWFLATLKTQSDRVAPMTEVQREEASAEIGSRKGIGLSSFDKAAYLMFLEPWRESAAAAMLNACNAGGSSQFDKPAHLRKLVADYYRNRAASGPDSAAWRRGLRAVLLFGGDYAGARSLSRELVKEDRPEFAVRDRVLAGLTERIYGNRKPLDDAIAACPQPPRFELERWDDVDSDPTHHCLATVLWDIDRAIVLAPRNTLPHAYVELLQESAEKSPDVYLREFAIGDLQQLDLELAKNEYQKLLYGAPIPDDVRNYAYFSLALIAEQQKRWADGIQWIDDYIDASFRQPVQFTPELWKIFAEMPESSSHKANVITEAYDHRFAIAIGDSDFANARRTVEDLMTYTQAGVAYSAPFVYDTRLLLIRLAEAEAAAGFRQETLRILGFVARNPLNEQFTSMVDFVRKKLSSGEVPVEPKREETPWDSPARALRRKRQPPTNASRIST